MFHKAPPSDVITIGLPVFWSTCDHKHNSIVVDDSAFGKKRRLKSVSRSELLNKRLGGMGGCCCSSRKHQFRGTPVYYYYPRSSEEHDSLTSHDGIATVRASALLIDLNLNMSTPDTYRPPPAPLPYDVVFGRPESTDPEPGEVAISAHTLEKPSCIVLKEVNCLKESESLPVSPKKVGLEFLKLEPLTVSMDEDDTCPTCLEEYNKENPKILTKCGHHFHLSCILEWKERSSTCPICDQEMIYERL